MADCPRRKTLTVPLQDIHAPSNLPLSTGSPPPLMFQEISLSSPAADEDRLWIGIVEKKLHASDKTPNHPSLNLSNFTKVTLQTGKDSLKGLLCGSQDLRARGESQIRL